MAKPGAFHPGPPAKGAWVPRGDSKPAAARRVGEQVVVLEGDVVGPQPKPELAYVLDHAIGREGAPLEGRHLSGWPGKRRPGPSARTVVEPARPPGPEIGVELEQAVVGA